MQLNYNNMHMHMNFFPSCRAVKNSVDIFLLLMDDLADADVGGGVIQEIEYWSE